MKIRYPSFAGMFYPAIQSDLNLILNTFKSKDRYSYDKNIKIIVSPHAGYIYSGQCASIAYSAVEKKFYKRVIIIAPSHHGGEYLFYKTNMDVYQTPLGNIEIDTDFNSKLSQYYYFGEDEKIEQNEHSLEVQIPFLQSNLYDGFKLVPILFVQQNLINSKLLADLILKESNNLEDTLLVISTDLSHYYDSETAIKKDNRFIESFEKGNPKELYNLITSGKAEACGFGGVLVAMEIAEQLKLNKHICNYTHSGETSGDYYQVVGYFSAIIMEE